MMKLLNKYPIIELRLFNYSMGNNIISFMCHLSTFDQYHINYHVLCINENLK